MPAGCNAPEWLNAGYNARRFVSGNV